jgi:hypothetical protein
MIQLRKSHGVEQMKKPFSKPECNWKKALQYIEKNMFVRVFNYNSRKLKLQEHRKKIVDFAQSFTDLDSFKKSCLSKDNILDEQRYFYELNVLANMIKDDLVKYDFVEALDYQDEIFLQLTPKGIDAVLKIQEHDDNERRFQQQSEISTTLKSNSTKSLWIAWGALIMSTALVYLSYERLNKLEDKIISHNDIDISIKTLEDKSNTLALENEKLKSAITLLKESKPEDKSNTLALENEKLKSAITLLKESKPEYKSNTLALENEKLKGTIKLLKESKPEDIPIANPVK